MIKALRLNQQSQRCPDIGVLRRALQAAAVAPLSPSRSWPSAPDVPAAPRKYLTVVRGLATEMTQAAKAAVDAEWLTQQTAQQQFRDELAHQDLCSTAPLVAITTQRHARRAAIQANRDAMTTVGSLRTELTEACDKTFAVR